MTPSSAPNNLTRNPLPPTSFGFVGSESPYGDTPDHLTFDEMREMPMHMALGFDTSDD